MIIPVRCFTCGKAIGHLWTEYIDSLQKKYNESNNKITVKEVFDIKNTSKTPEYYVIEKLDLKRYCCRRMLLGNIDMSDTIQ